MELTVSDKNRIQVAGHAVELAGGGGAIGSCSCSGRRSRGHPIPCSCTARPCTQGGGETKVQRETLSKIIQAGSVTRDRISHHSTSPRPPPPYRLSSSSLFFLFLAPLTSFLLGSKKKKKKGTTFQRVEAVKGENECLFCRLMIDTVCVCNRKLEGYY